MALMCHVIATSVRSGGLAVEVLSTHMSGVILHLAALSRFLFFFFRKKLFSPFCWQNGALEILMASTTPTLPFSQLCERWGGGSAFTVFRHGLHWSGMGLSMVNQWEFSPLAAALPVQASPSLISFGSSRSSEMGILSTDRGPCVRMCALWHMCEFSGCTLFSVWDPPNQAWHHTRGPSFYPSLISTSPATSLHYWQGPDCRSNQSTLMANSFQSCAKPIMSHPEPRTGPGEIGQAGKRRTGVILGLTQFTTTHSKTHIHTH